MRDTKRGWGMWANGKGGVWRDDAPGCRDLLRLADDGCPNLPGHLDWAEPAVAFAEVRLAARRVDAREGSEIPTPVGR